MIASTYLDLYIWFPKKKKAAMDEKMLNEPSLKAKVNARRFK